MNLQTLFSGFIFVIMIFVISACGGTKLLDIEKTSSVLNLSDTQRRVVQSKVQQIDEIVEDYELEKETLESRVRKKTESDAEQWRGSEVVDEARCVAVLKVRCRRSINSAQLSKNRLIP